MALTPGTRLGPYIVSDRIGSGGMGEVYRARDTRLKREVALKILPESFATDPERLARFQREAEVLASLNHPNIAGIYGLEGSNGIRALVMELVEGETLAARVAGGPIPIDEALQIAKQIAEALEAAHEQGIIHRDLKPANVKLRTDGTAKVLDFGLAKALEPVSAPVDATASPTITSPAMMTGVGMLLGTAAYMSPEQARGKAVDKRSDIWAFGCVLFEMLTSQRAFQGEDVSETLARVIERTPDLSRLPSPTPAGIHRLLRRVFQKEASRRVQSAGDLRVEIQEAIEGAHGLAPDMYSAPPALHQGGLRRTSQWRSIVGVGVALSIIAALGAVATWQLTLSAPQPAVARLSVPIPDGQQLTTLNRRLVAISPDGTQLAYVANRRLFLRSIREFDTHEIAGTEDAFGIGDPTFSPDGRSIAFHADRTIKRVGISGGAPVTICTAGENLGDMTWDSTGIVFSESTGIFRCSPTGGTPQRLAAVGVGEEADDPQLLPDGSTLLFTVASVADGDSRWDKARVVVQSMNTGVRKEILTGGSDPRYVRTGHLLYSTRGIVFAVPFDPVGLMVTGQAVAVLEGVMRPRGVFTGSVQVVYSDTGTLVYLPGPVGTPGLDRALALADRAGSVTRLPVKPGPYGHVRASRDGMRLAVGADDGREAAVWIYELAGTNAIRRLTFGGQNRFPVWSPDGRRIAFQSDREGDLSVFAQNADGTGVVERLTKAESGVAHVPESWSPDNRFLLVSVRKNEQFTLRALSLDRRDMEDVSDVESMRPINAVLSPDGRWLAYSWQPQGRAVQTSSRGVYVRPFPISSSSRYQVPKQTGSIDYHPLWAPDGMTLFYVPSAGSGELAAVKVTTHPTVAFSNPESVPARVTEDRTSTQMRAFDVLPDGRFVGPIFPTDAAVAGAANEVRVVLNWFEELKRLVPAN